MDKDEPFGTWGGRKFVLTCGGCLLVTCLSLFAPQAQAEAIQAIAAMILVFNGANAAVTWGSMRSSATKDETVRSGKAMDEADAV